MILGAHPRASFPVDREVADDPVARSGSALDDPVPSSSIDLQRFRATVRSPCRRNHRSRRREPGRCVVAPFIRRFDPKSQKSRLPDQAAAPRSRSTTHSLGQTLAGRRGTGSPRGDAGRRPAPAHRGPSPLERAPAHGFVRTARPATPRSSRPAPTCSPLLRVPARVNRPGRLASQTSFRSFADASNKADHMPGYRRRGDDARVGKDEISAPPRHDRETLFGGTRRRSFG